MTAQTQRDDKGEVEIWWHRDIIIQGTTGVVGTTMVITSFSQ